MRRSVFALLGSAPIAALSTWPKILEQRRYVGVLRGPLATAAVNPYAGLAMRADVFEKLEFANRGLFSAENIAFANRRMDVIEGVGYFRRIQAPDASPPNPDGVMPILDISREEFRRQYD